MYKIERLGPYNNISCYKTQQLLNGPFRFGSHRLSFIQAIDLNYNTDCNETFIENWQDKEEQTWQHYMSLDYYVETYFPPFNQSEEEIEISEDSLDTWECDDDISDY